jgi:FemAB-related protein (PEP-CTERM system-associated)
MSAQALDIAIDGRVPISSTVTPDAYVTRVVVDERGEWRRLARQLGGHLAHAPEWSTVIQETYGHEPLYLMATDEIGRGGVLSAFIVRRPLLGPVVTSMPFLDGGGPRSASPALTIGLVDALIAHAHRVGASAVDLRCHERLPLAWQPMEHKVNLVLPLPPDPDEVWHGLHRTVRNQIRKAYRSGLCVEFGGVERLDAFYRILSIRMRELGSPVHGRAFFRSILTRFGAQARIAIVRNGTLPIGGMLMLACNNVLTVPWASCLTRYSTLCPNMVLYWEAILAGCVDGCERFDFGRSTRGSGTYHFKRQWGAEEVPLYWYTIPINGWSALSPGNRATSSRLADVWTRLPLPVTRHLGPRLRRYLVQ